MQEAIRTSSRRGVLGRAVMIAAGALGLGAEGARAASRPTTLQLHGRALHLHSPSRRPGEVPAKGERFTAYAELLDRPGGLRVGRFTAAYLALDSPFAAGPGSLELHTFDLDGGTIHGLGSAVTGAEGHFAIVGGTGRWAGARGSYVAVQQPRELGGDGTAVFHLTLAGQEA